MQPSRGVLSQVLPERLALFLQSERGSAAAAATFSAFFLVLFLTANHRHPQPLPPQQPQPQPPGEPGPVTLEGTREIIEGREAVWQLPAHLLTEEWKGVAFYAHGCSHKAVDWWPQSKNCLSCVGLPEDQGLVRAAISRGYAVIAISSEDVCWDAGVDSPESREVMAVKQVLDTWRKTHSLRTLPLVALGASSGGYFISSLALAVELQAQVLLIASGIRAAFQGAGVGRKTYPPTLFVHMPKDGGTASNVMEAMTLLKSKGVQTADIKCQEKQVHESFFSDRIDGLPAELSAKIVGALKAEGVINKEGYLTKNYRAGWQQTLESGRLLTDPSLGPKINEELAFAFGWHEMTSEFAKEIIDWFDGVCSTSEGIAKGGRCDGYP